MATAATMISRPAACPVADGSGPYLGPVTAPRFLSAFE